MIGKALILTTCPGCSLHISTSDNPESLVSTRRCLPGSCGRIVRDSSRIDFIEVGPESMLVHGQFHAPLLVFEEGRAPVNIVVNMRLQEVDDLQAVTGPEVGRTFGVTNDSFSFVLGRPSDEWKEAIASLSTPSLGSYFQGLCWLHLVPFVS